MRRVEEKAGLNDSGFPLADVNGGGESCKDRHSSCRIAVWLRVRVRLGNRLPFGRVQCNKIPYRSSK
jgi:hypothetical protein